MAYRNRYDDVQDDEPSRQAPREQVSQLAGPASTTAELTISDLTAHDTMMPLQHQYQPPELLHLPPLEEEGDTSPPKPKVETETETRTER